MKGSFKTSLHGGGIIANRIKGKEREFCVCFAETGDAELSARLAGYKLSPRSKGTKLLSRDYILDEIERLIGRKKRLSKALASVGYSRLAFGGISDATSLLYKCNLSEDEFKELDLFMISEIKKPKDGSLEIKFFDRLKALEKLENLGDEKTAGDLFDAIGSSCGSEDDA